MKNDGFPEVFISYASKNREKVTAVVEQIRSFGVNIWRDQEKIEGGMNYGREIVLNIKGSKVIILMCTEAAIRSKNVKQEIQLAWKYDRPYLPLILEKIDFPEQVEYWLEGWQWIEVLDKSPVEYMPQVLRALKTMGVTVSADVSQLTDIKGIDGVLRQEIIQQVNNEVVKPVQTVRLAPTLDGLRSLAKFSDQIWPVPAEKANPAISKATRGLGAPQTDIKHKYRLGDRVKLIIESEHEGHLMLLDEGPEKIVYCLCPSWFAPQTRITPGKHYLPQENSQYSYFEVSGETGREHLLAIISDEPLLPEWMPIDDRIPARTLSDGDIDALIARLKGMEGNSWAAIATYFEIES